MSAPLATQNFSFKCNLVSRKLFLPLSPPVALLLNMEMAFAFTFTFHPDLRHAHTQPWGPVSPISTLVTSLSTRHLNVNSQKNIILYAFFGLLN